MEVSNNERDWEPMLWIKRVYSESLPKASAQSTGRCLSFSFKIAACLAGRREGFLWFCVTLDSWAGIIPAIFRVRAPGFFPLVQFLLALSTSGKHSHRFYQRICPHSLNDHSCFHGTSDWKVRGSAPLCGILIKEVHSPEVLLFHQLNPLIPI